jgi:two-component system response regulator HydG
VSTLRAEPVAGAVEPSKILVVDDDPAMVALIANRLRAQYDVRGTTSTDEALALLAAERWHAVLTDLNMPGMSGLDLCKRIVEAWPDVPVVVLTAHGSLDAAVAAMRAGAFDFATKPPDWNLVSFALGRATQHARLKHEVRRLAEVAHGSRPEGIVGESGAIREVLDLVDRVRASDATVLVTGESGTGKEVVARAVHTTSKRQKGPFVAINCAAMPETLLESELFGHAKGAFTDARSARVGLIAQASGGTLFLDEIGDMPIGLQPKLLRVLQERTVRPVGQAAEIPVDVRVIAATNKDLETEIEAKRFREDLYFRLNVVQIQLPPLRARSGDVLLLAQDFLRRFAARSGKDVHGIAPDAAAKLASYDWPGNVRELQNAIERAVALARYDQITPDDLPDRIRKFEPSQFVLPSHDPSELVPMAEVERRYVERVLMAVGGNKTMAARVLGYDRKRLYRKLARYGLGPVPEGTDPHADDD